MPHDHRGKLRRGRRRAIDLVGNKAVARGVHEIENVIQAGGKFVNVLAVKGRDERLVQLDVDLVSHFIAATLDFLDAVYRLLNLLETEKKIAQNCRTLRDIVGNLHEHLKKFSVSRDQSHEYGTYGAASFETPALYC